MSAFEAKAFSALEPDFGELRHEIDTRHIGKAQV